MKAVAAKKWLIGLCSCLMVVFSLLPAVSAYAADSYPYFKDYGADVSAGGWFADNTGNCSGGNYQTGTAASPDTGGIVTYANTGAGSTANGGASSQYAAFATGNIDGTSGSPNSGFYSDGAIPGNKVYALTFADITNLPWGGDFDGGTPQPSECIPDYFDNAQQAGIPIRSGAVPAFSGLSGQFLFNNGAAVTTINASDQSLAKGQQLTIFVNGDAYIDGNITYQAHDATSVPKFAVVARGNIYIDHSVSQLAGWYIAQPTTTGTPTSTDGEIWTCHDGTPVSGLNTIYASAAINCGNQLTITGALTAKMLIFNRIGGNVLTETTTSADQPGVTNDPNAAEVINYTPDMVVDGGFFGKTSNSSSAKVESLVSLPPVF